MMETRKKTIKSNHNFFLRKQYFLNLEKEKKSKKHMEKIFLLDFLPLGNFGNQKIFIIFLIFFHVYFK